MSERMLTDDDVKEIADAICARLPPCSLGITHEEASFVRSYVKWWKRATTTIGTVILTAITVAIVGIFSKGFWVSLIEGAKK